MALQTSLSTGTAMESKQLSSIMATEVTLNTPNGTWSMQVFLMILSPPLWSHWATSSKFTVMTAIAVPREPLSARRTLKDICSATT